MLIRLVFLLTALALPAWAGGVSGGPFLSGGGGSSSYTPPPTPVTQRNPLNTDDFTLGYFPPNSIDNLYQTTAAAGCTSAPTITLPSPSTGGIQATGTVIMNGAVSIAAIITNPGSNYLSNPTSLITATGGGCSTEPVFRASYNPTGALWNGPSGIFAMQEGATAGAAVWTRIQNVGKPLDVVVNPVSAATPVAGGTGYSVGNTITLANGTVLTVATLSGSAVATVTVATAGSWPCGQAATQSQVSTSGSGTGATFSLTIQGAQGAYGSRLLTACYTTNKDADIERASDSAVLTIGFVNGAFDTSTASGFCAGTTCKVIKRYDQSGFGNDCTSSYSNAEFLDFNALVGGVPAFTNGYCTIPSSLSASSTSISAFWLGDNLSYGGTGSNAIVAGPLSFYNNVAYFFNDDSGSITTSFYPSISPELIGAVVSNNSVASYSQNDFETQCFTGTNCAYTGIVTGGSIGSSSPAGPTAAVIVTSRAYSASERTALRAAFYNTFNIYPQIRDVVLASGDSRTQGVNATNGINYPYFLKDLTSLPIKVYQTGASGATSANRNSTFMPNDVLPFLQPHGKNIFIVDWIGYNDFQASISATTTYSNVTTYIGLAGAYGVPVVVSTETEGGTQVSAFNTLVSANSGGAVATCPQMVNDPAWTGVALGVQNTPQVFINSPHPTTYGYGFVAQDLANCLQPLFK